MNARIRWTMVALAGIWGSVIVVSAFSPDLVSGSQQEHLPLALYVTWLWGALATRWTVGAMVRRSNTPNALAGIALVTVGIWVVVAAASVVGPVMVTGSDPTTLPIAAILAPIGGAVVTGFAGDMVRLVLEGSGPDESSAGLP